MNGGPPARANRLIPRETSGIEAVSLDRNCLGWDWKGPRVSRETTKQAPQRSGEAAERGAQGVLDRESRGGFRGRHSDTVRRIPAELDCVEYFTPEYMTIESPDQPTE